MWRSRLGISQEELAGRAGLHRTYVCDVERGARNLSLESIEKLAHALQISVASLFSYESPSAQPDARQIPGNGLVDILFVEDDPSDVVLTLAALKNITNRVQVPRDGLAALDLLFGSGDALQPRRPDQPRLILLDLGLPKINGLDVLRRVKSDSRTASIPVVVLTASDSDRDLQISKRLGAAAYIIKPVGMNNLTEIAPQLSLRWALLKSPPMPAPATRPELGVA